VQGIFDKLGYQAQASHEGLAIVYSELKDANFTGIGMSFVGGSATFGSRAYIGHSPAHLSRPTRAGDYSITSGRLGARETPPRLRLQKENAAESRFKLNAGRAERSTAAWRQLSPTSSRQR